MTCINVALLGFRVEHNELLNNNERSMGIPVLPVLDFAFNHDSVSVVVQFEYFGLRGEKEESDRIKKLGDSNHRARYSNIPSLDLVPVHGVRCRQFMPRRSEPKRTILFLRTL
jgi:hypothetical protein